MSDLPSKIEVVVVGGGQAGIAASEHLTANGLKHVVLEKTRLAESWRTRRWDSLVANGPAWHDKFPNLDFKGEQDAFVSKDTIVEYFENYAKLIGMPIYSGITVTKVTPQHGKPGFLVETSTGKVIECRNVIAATGAFQIPVIPQMVPKSDDLYQIHSLDYKKPEQLPEGNVLVVGAGSSGAQIAEELALQRNRKVYLSVGVHDRPPRSYRGRDFCWWLAVLNKWDMEATPQDTHTTIAVSGANGGKTMDFRRLASEGVTLLGHTDAFKDGKLIIGNDLKENIAQGDVNYLNVLDEADAYIAENGIDLPEEPSAREFLPDPPSLVNPILEVDLKKEGITSIIWATGFRNDYQWLASTKAITAAGKPNHKRGISEEQGIFFLGLPWLTRRGSSFIWGVWHDAKYIADSIAKMDKYLAYQPAVVK